MDAAPDPTRSLELRVRALEERLLNLSLPEQPEAWTAQSGPETEAWTLASTLPALTPVLVPIPLWGVLRARRVVFALDAALAAEGKVSAAIYRTDAIKVSSTLPADGEGALGATGQRPPLHLVRELGAVPATTGRHVLDFTEAQLNPTRAFYFLALAASTANVAVHTPVQGQLAAGWFGLALESADLWPTKMHLAAGAVGFQPAAALYSARAVMARGY